MKISSENKIRLGFGGAFFLLLIAFFYSAYTTTELLYHIKTVNSTNQTIHHLDGLSMAVKNLESSFENKMPLDSNFHSGYYLQSFNEIDSLCLLIQQDVQHEYIPTFRMREILNNINDIHNEILIQINPDKNHQSRPPVIGKDMVIALGTLKARIDDMEASERALLALRSNELNSSSDYIMWLNIAIVLVALILALYSLVVYTKENKAKRKANHIIVEYIQTLEKKMRELSVANSELNKLRNLQKFIATGRIARIIAHEVRNPLTNINLSCEQLKEVTLYNESAMMLLDTIMRNSYRINHLIGELLQVTQTQDLHFQKISINDLLDDTLKLAQDRIQLQHVRVEKYFDQDICDVEVDIERIKIAFLNIIVNAVEAMQKENSLLILRTESKNNKCVVTISDNGTGIEKDTLEKIFDPYFTSKEKGTGLGLANTQNIIVNHKGSVEVESEPGVGTTFTITLNFAEDSALV